MSKVCKIICLLLALSGNSVAASEWTPDDTARQVALTALICVDWMQTQEIVKDSHEEMNPVLGKHPSMKRVNITIGSAIVLSFIIAKMLPSKYRKWFQFIVIGAESAAIYNNYRRGISINF